MRRHLRILLSASLLAWCSPVDAAEPAQWVSLFNGNDLTGWVNVNTEEDTWKVRDGLLICTGKPIGGFKNVSTTGSR